MSAVSRSLMEGVAVDRADNAAGVPLETDTMGAVVVCLLVAAWWALSNVRRPQGGRW